MMVDLVNITTRDGVTLHGAFHDSLRPATERTMDAAILLSGVGSNFYASELIETVAMRLQSDGIAALRINTRGHDGVSTARTASGGRLQGAAYEIVDDCRHDLAGWVAFLRTRGYQRLGLIGHSLGALKALYAQAHEGFESVELVVAISPPCLSYDRFRRSDHPAAFQQSLARAEMLIQQGEPETLFRATFPFPLLLSPQTFVDKYGPGERYNLLRWAPQIRCPLQFVFGERELQKENVAFAGLVEDLQQLSWAMSPRIEIVAGANHSYAGQFDPLTDIISQSPHPLSE